MKRKLLVLLLISVIILACIACSTSWPDPIMKVTGTATSVDIYFAESEEVPFTDLDSVSLPWEFSLANVNPDSLFSFGASSNDFSDETIRCELIVGGKVVAEMEKTAPLALVTCTTVLSEVMGN